ncbi:MAG: hypothetical protein H8D46_03890 [FCB group bacterium]|nr:hypothetical protein [FCB group bacterium]
MDKFLNFIVKLGSVDRRVIFLLVGLSVLIPLIKPINIPIRAGHQSQTVYEAVAGLPANSNVLVSFEYGPSTKPEIHPMAVALLRQLFKAGHKVYGMALWPDGLFMSTEAFDQVAEEEFGLKYGEDYVNLGFRPGNEAVVKGVAADIRTLYTVDTRGNQVSEIPMMRDIVNVTSFGLVFSLSAGYPGGKEWVQFACDPNDVMLSTGCTSIQVTEILPYVENGQISGVLAGMPGAAEYEKLIGITGEATGMMAAQSFAHVVIVLFIVFGNITYFIHRQRSKKV